MAKQHTAKVSKPPPPLIEQKRLRQKDRTIVPSAPYLLVSKIVDVSCDLPVVSNICPADTEGGWRSSLPNGWGEFPTGKLSHSYSSYFGDDIVADVSYGDFLQSENAVDVSKLSGSDAISGTLTNYYNFAFNTSTTTLCDLTNPLALCILLALVVMVRIIKRFFLPKFSALGLRLGRSAHGPEWEVDNEERIVKFGEYVYRLCYHSAVSLYGLWYFYDKSWWNNSMGGTKNLWILHPNHPVEPGMAWYYLIQSAYNVDAMLSLMELSFSMEWVNPFAYSSALEFLEKEHVVDDTQRKKEVLKLMVKSRFQTLLWTPLFQIKWSPTIRGDFREMMAHHIVTNVLIFGSSFYRFTRIGSMIFLVHDLSDVPIDMSKLANFVKWKTTTIICFVFMVLMWIVTRLVIFPFVIFRSVLFESYEFMVIKGPLDPALYEAYCYIFYLLLGSLVLLHVTWFLILLRIGWTLVRKGETHDYSEHKSGEAQHAAKKRD
ncbi:predicted protein [Thalassiosira pseudonana CCMP1335]|uniref:TLC domain-containing protein n=1 Tax=Thalassiosira pseudonana TaxID=35128 RepID=B8CFL6_THAPS|nr:predicted protein [Thalassiosira pseudonana CCMP1335]EED87821.1 predicted protein [Thalassiosira pseudonana CCMP1335]